MTERGRESLHRTASSIAIGKSMLNWDGDVLTIGIEEVTAPIPLPLKGIVRVYPNALAGRAFPLDPEMRHRWQPIAPRAHVEVAMQQPQMRWHGVGYVDTNSGDEPIENGFQSWHWSRVDLGSRTAVLYDITHRRGSGQSLAVSFAPSGAHEELEPPPPAALPPTRWKIARATRADAAESVAVVRTLESAPFYARSLLSTRLFGRRALAMHESLSLERFRSLWVQATLPFRMPRVIW
jgi:carotenoid 1,2-hydratase